MESANKVRYWLVEQPMVREFEWRQGETWGASPLFLATTVVTYLSLTLFFYYFYVLSLKTTSMRPLVLRTISTLHNLMLVILSIIMALGCIVSTTSQMPDYRWFFCFPLNHKPQQRGPLFFWAYVFYLSKILEFVDTLFIILNKDTRRLSFLHVYHHAAIVVMSYFWIHIPQSLFPVGIATNSSVHVLMYSYYMGCTLGKKPAWKRLVTDCQILQFWLSFVESLVMLWFHFTGNGCSGIGGLVCNVVFNASLLALFSSFHANNYTTTTKRKDKKM